MGARLRKCKRQVDVRRSRKRIKTGWLPFIAPAAGFVGTGTALLMALASGSLCGAPTRALRKTESDQAGVRDSIVSRVIDAISIHRALQGGPCNRSNFVSAAAKAALTLSRSRLLQFAFRARNHLPRLGSSVKRTPSVEKFSSRSATACGKQRPCQRFIFALRNVD